MAMDGPQNTKFCKFSLYHRIGTAGRYSSSKISSQWRLAQCICYSARHCNDFNKTV